MKRTPLKRGEKPLRRKSAMPKPSKPMAKRNAKRAKKRHERDFGDKADWIRGLSCAGCQKRSRWMHAHHARTRGAGGDASVLVPLCPPCHDTAHTEGRRTFEAKRGVDLMALAERLEALWQEMQGRAA